MLADVGYSNDPALAVQRLLDDLCVKLGFCLPPAERQRLEEDPPANVDAFTDAVLAAEGLDGRNHRQHRAGVRALVERHLGH